MQDKLYKFMNWAVIEGIIYSEEDNPHAVLGPHKMGNYLVFQTYQPGAVAINILLRDEKKILPMEIADEAGYFAAMMLYRKVNNYQYEVEYEDGTKKVVEDAYRFLPTITSSDTDKFEAGIHYTLYEKLGAHLCTIDGVRGCEFAVWAPNAVRISVVGDFNSWDGRVHQMRRLWDSGIFEIFIPEAKEGDCYKFELKLKGGLTYLKADPYAYGQELRPDTASIICNVHDFKWTDQAWMKARKEKQAETAPISIYECYLGSFIKPKQEEEKKSLASSPEKYEEKTPAASDTYSNYRELADALVPYLTEMGYTHVELMPIMEHPFDASWGYQTIGYYAPTSRYGSARDFQYFMNTLHEAGLGVILDWVPAHFPKDDHGLSNFDGTCLYEHKDPRQGMHPHWGTLIYNYGRAQVKNYLIANALYWAEVYHADGIRMDAVASMLYLDYGREDGQWVANIYGGNENLEAVEFIKHVNSVMKKRNPGVMMIAEESTAWPKVTGKLNDDGLGFDWKWNMGWMNDYLNYIAFDPYFRAHHHDELTFSMIYAYSEKFILPLSHDEVVHGKASMIGKMPGETEDKFANLRLSFAYMMTHPGKKLLFMGQDIGEFDEFNENRELHWDLLKYDDHKGLKQMVADLNHLYQSHPALHKKDTKAEGFGWVNAIDYLNCKLSFMRYEDNTRKGEKLFIYCNFANVSNEQFVGVPKAGKYKEIFNSDAKIYGGTGFVNPRVKRTVKQKVDGQKQAIKVKVAPLSVMIFTYSEEDK